MKNKIFGIIMSLAVMSSLFSCLNDVEATTIKDNEMFSSFEDDVSYWIEDDVIVDSEGFEYSNFVNGSGDAVLLEDALLSLSGSTENNNQSFINNNDLILGKRYSINKAVSPLEQFGIYIDSIQRNQIQRGKEYKMSADVRGPGVIDKSKTKTISASMQCSVSVSADIEAAIFVHVGLECGVSVTTSAAESTTLSYRLNVKDGKIGALYFSPYYVKAVGRIKNTKYTSYLPQLIPGTGEVDGLFYIKYKK